MLLSHTLCNTQIWYQGNLTKGSSSLEKYTKSIQQGSKCHTCLDPVQGLQCLHSPREWLLITKLSLPVLDWSTSWSQTRCLLNTRLSLPRADLGLYHGPRPDIYHSTEWSLNTRLSLHRGPGPGGPILLREGLSMLLRKINTPSQRERHSLPYQACHKST